MVETEGCQSGGWSASQNADRSRDWSRQLDSRESKTRVIADQQAAVKRLPGLVHTARHTVGGGFTRRREPNRKEGAYRGGLHDWGEVGTR